MSTLSDNQMSEKKEYWKNILKPSKASGKKLFWTWVCYQAVKGILTTSLIWIPLLLAYLNS